jgi:hypothetical protein
MLAWQQGRDGSIYADTGGDGRFHIAQRDQHGQRFALKRNGVLDGYCTSIESAKGRAEILYATLLLVRAATADSMEERP